MRLNKAKYDLAMARACKSKKDIIKTGVPASTLAGICKRNISPVTVGKIARALGCDVTDIID